MFFPLSFLPPNKAEEVFKFLNEAREKENKRQQEELKKKKRKEEFNKLFKNPPTSITGMLGYSYLVGYMNSNN
tara:strand:+ start:702 stop:920 length:219 start_codon:yes stop_codon:yes gene_type:complete